MSSRAALLLWMCFAGMFLYTVSSALPSSELSITKCVIIQYTNITCYWKTTNLHPNNSSSYRLQINKTTCQSRNGFIPVGVCETRGSNCSVQPIDSALHCFNTDVLASTSNGSIRSPPFFFEGVNAVQLRPPQITHLRPSANRSECLEVVWRITESFPKKERVFIRLQMEYTTHGQTQSQIVQAFPQEALQLCNLHPGSKYTVQLRVQDRRAQDHWSSWTSVETTTAERAPSVAPRIWRQIHPAGEAGKRRLTLHWKAVSWPEVNGVVVRYSAWCRSELDTSHWSCPAINASRSFCVLFISDHPCVCSLTAINSAGASPAAYISIFANTHADELPPPQNISVTSLDDTRLKVEWTSTFNQSESGFVLQWTSVPHSGPSDLYWEQFNETARSFIVTGLLSGVPYDLSVVSLFGQQTGGEISAIAFTQEAAPSVGPQLKVLKISSSSVSLKWDPVPLEKLHGFIRHYSVLWSINGKDKNEQVGAGVCQMSLDGLTAGVYNISVKAHTAAGGAVGPWQMVAVGLEDVQVIPILLCALLLTSLILIIAVCMRVKIKQCLCPTVPDPSKSSVSTWSNRKPSQHMFQTSFMSSIMSLDQGYSEKDYVPVQVFPYHTISHHDNKNTQTNTSNSSSTITYLEPKLQKTFPAFFPNQSYSIPDPILPAGYKQDPADLLFESLLDHQDNHANSCTDHADLCGYMHVSQSYAPFVTIVDSYRILEPHELPQSVQVLSDDTNT
ncbi:interleukin-6 receptor subunit beta [Danio aesculapii]|uniref:interleukin-6 receptor subunit beta n=1 Tax=Danio aesculapii TaxID=1142201 RepID=UPI0024C05785|nr:interleukin-6 receptor subunit beta [Danio aesculapii]